MTTRPGGRVERRRRQRMRRRRRTLAGLLVVGVFALVAIALHPPTWRAWARPAAPQPGAASQDVVLLQVVDDSGTIAGALLVGGGGRPAAAVLLPSRLLVDVPGAGVMPLARAGAIGGDRSVAQAVGDLLGISVDATWTWPVRDIGATDRVATPTNLRPGEPELVRVARLQPVLDALLRGSAGGDLAELGRASVPSARLARLLAGVRRAARAETLTHQIAPVRPVESGALPAYTLDQAPADQLVRAWFAGSLAPGRATADNRVLVRNGVGTPALGASARDRLARAGFRYVGGGNADTFRYQRSLIAVTDPSAAALTRGGQVASALGLPPSAVGVAQQGQSIADVIVILGRDYRP